MSVLSKINHLSPSSLSTWRNTPAKWVMHYLHGVKDESDKPGAWRGSAVEAGMDVALYGASDEEAFKRAAERFELDAQGQADDKCQKERENVARCLRNALAGMDAGPGRGTPNARQFKVELRANSAPMPIMGYVDYTWPTWLMDLKTSGKRPSSASADHVMQVAFYWKATGRTPKLLYAAPTGFFWGSPTEDELKAAWHQVELSARSLCRFLDRARDANDALAMLGANLDDFRWSDEMRTKYLKLIAA